MLLTALIFGLVLSFLVIIHELGHYLAAKWQKIHVGEFGLGYPPRVVTLFHRWNTNFSINAIPFGGFVSLEGEDGPPDQEAQQARLADKSLGKPFFAASARSRMIIILAGATVNLIFGVIAFAIVFSFRGIPGGAIVAEITPGSVAAVAQVPVNEVIRYIETSDRTTRIVSYSQLRPLFMAHLGQEVTLSTRAQCGRTVCAETHRTTFRLPAAEQLDLTNPETPISGIKTEQFNQFFPWYEQIYRGILIGFEQAAELSLTILQLLRDMVGNLVTRGVVPQELAGPVGIAREANSAGILRGDWKNILLFAGILSINLGVMNLLPIPALDGGRAVFIILEKIVGRRRVTVWEGHANQYGMVLLIALMLAITARDIFRVVTGA